MLADVDTVGDLILFIDADSVFIRESRVKDFMANNCPIIRARLYEELIEWDPSEYNRIKVYPEYERAVKFSLGIDDPYHYMIGQPHLYYRDDVRGCRETIEAHCGMETPRKSCNNFMKTLSASSPTLVPMRCILALVMNTFALT